MWNKLIYRVLFRKLININRDFSIFLKYFLEINADNFEIHRQISMFFKICNYFLKTIRQSNISSFFRDFWKLDYLMTINPNV